MKKNKDKIQQEYFWNSSKRHQLVFYKTKNLSIPNNEKQEPNVTVGKSNIACISLLSITGFNLGM